MTQEEKMAELKARISTLEAQVAVVQGRLTGKPLAELVQEGIKIRDDSLPFPRGFISPSMAKAAITALNRSQDR
jgi:hypothetical protein